MTNKTRAIARRRSRLSLTWIDFLVIAAIVLTFAAIVSTTVSRAKASTHNSASSPEFSTEVSQIQRRPGPDQGQNKIGRRRALELSAR